MVVVIVGFSLLLSLLVEEIGRDVVHIHQFHASFLSHLTIPLSIGVVAAFDLAFGPLVAGSERKENRRSALLAHILDELLQVPSERVYHLIGARSSQFIHVAGVGSASNDATHFLIVDGAYVVVAELYEHIVAGLHAVVDLVPTTFIEIGARATSCLGTVHARDLLGIEHRVGL